MVEQSVFNRNVSGSTPDLSTICEYSLVLKLLPSKQKSRVGFSLFAPNNIGMWQNDYAVDCKSISSGFDSLHVFQ